MNWTKISFLIVVMFIIYMSLKTPSGGMEIQVNDKIGHTLAYFVLTLNLGVLLQKKNCWIAGIVTFSFSAILEYLQGFVPGRTVSSLDLIANASGAILGVLVLYFFHRSLLSLLHRWKLVK